MRLGMVDASLVALGADLSTTRITTPDERHLRILEPLTGEPAFTLLPADHPVRCCGRGFDGVLGSVLGAPVLRARPGVQLWRDQCVSR
jgi:hypothetical protein